jgi:HK97 family phage portal protein
MAIAVQSSGQMRSVETGTRVSYTDLQQDRMANAPMAYGYGNEYAAIYAAQPNVRTMVDFLARNFAQLGYHVFRRVSDTDRVRLPQHELAQWLEHPNPYTTRYRLCEGLLADLGIYFNAYWLKVRNDGAAQRVGLVRLPPAEVAVEGGLLPSAFVWTSSTSSRTMDLAPSEVVYFNGYNPLNAIMGLSPLDTLRGLLREAYASQAQREAYWRHGSRMDGVIERPKDAPRWTTVQKQEWRAQWQARSTTVGTTPVLEDGMTFKAVSYNARDSEYVAARKLSREECAAAYHIPQTMVGILDHATLNNVNEQHKQLYADTLGPWLKMVQEEIARQLLPDCVDTTNIYGEFNIAEKLKGSFEEQTSSLRVAVGRPFMTANEARARLNLPHLDDPSADALAAQQGGPAAPPLEESVPPSSAAAEATVTAPPLVAPPVLAPTPVLVAAIVQAALARQALRLEKLPVALRADALNPDRCTTELAADLTPLLGREVAQGYAARVTDQTYVSLVEHRDAFAPDRELPPLREVLYAA